MNEQPIFGNELSLRTVDKLRLDDEGYPQSYFIASYQRGYRWSPLQVTQLLDDILEFTERRNPQPDEFYCLQPIVLTVADNGAYEVVDGQQRITTLLLILRHFNERLTEKYRLPLFTIDYETRPDLLEFLEDPTEEKANSNADFFHFLQALRAIEDWFDNYENKVDDIKAALLNKTKVIWFQLSDSDSPVDAFTRLNVGKIPLTNDELIRALFLKRESVDQTEAEDLQRQIANEWDQYEKSLQANGFWYFISNDTGRKQNRISLLFELVAHSKGLKEAEKNDDYGVFCAFNRWLTEEVASTRSQWWEIKKTFMTLDEWFSDRTLYHIIGFLIHESFDIRKFRKLSEGCTKSEFDEVVRAEIFKHVIGRSLPEEFSEDDILDLVAARVEELTYENSAHHNRIRSLLLLFNIASLLEDTRSTIRFQFDSFKTGAWDIEHVRSVASERLQSHKERTEWLSHSLHVLKATIAQEKLCKQIDAYLKLPPAEQFEEAFDALYDKVVKYFKETTHENDHSVANLVLLDQSTNRSYKNAVFAVKRQRLLSLDRAGIFVPLCTRNVFLKCYSDHVDQLMFWSEADRTSYQKTIVKTLTDFFVNKEL